jgi:hypothetical protein
MDGTVMRWSPARVFMLVSALYHLPLGIVGLLYDRTFPIGSAEAARAGSEFVFGIFETNGWHSSAALVLGVVSLYFLMRPSRARDVALAIGVFHVGIVAALVIWPPETFWLASNAADQVVHSFTAIAGIGAALLTRERRWGTA